LPIVGEWIKRKARKNYVCQDCGKAIPKGSDYWSYESLFTDREKVCLDCFDQSVSEITNMSTIDQTGSGI